jgi:hypothetical protein
LSYFLGHFELGGVHSKNLKVTFAERKVGLEKELHIYNQLIEIYKLVPNLFQ